MKVLFYTGKCVAYWGADENDYKCIFGKDECIGEIGTLDGSNDDTLYCKNIPGTLNLKLREEICNNAYCGTPDPNKLTNVVQYDDANVNLPCYCQIVAPKPRPCAPGTVFSEEKQVCVFP